jgi:hypothetical protein
VPLTKVVVRAAPFQFTTDPFTKPLPLTDRVKAAVPAVALDGDRLLMVGTGLGALTVNVDPAEVPPPGAGLNTVTCAVPALAISVVEIAADTFVALTKVVVRAAPFQFTTDPFTKPLPVTDRVNAALPAVALEGDRLLTVGTGLGALIANADPGDVPPPGVGLTMVTWAVPALVMSAAEIAADNCVALMKVVVRAAPFQFTTDPFTKPVPVTVRLNAAVPAVALDGARPLIVGTGFNRVSVPPVPVTLARVPSGNAPISPANSNTSELLMVPEATVTVTTATTSLAIVFVFMPVAMQLTDPADAPQLKVLAAFVSPGPATMLSAVMSVSGYEIFH